MGDGEYGSTTEVKAMLGLSPTDAVDDTLIATYVQRGNRQVDNALAGYIDVPVASASITDDLQTASNNWASRMYSQFRHSFDKADQFKSTYNDIIKGAKNRHTAQRTTRRAIRAVSKDYLTEPMASDPLLD